MNANTVTVQLTVKDDGSVVMQQFGKNSEDALNKTSTAAPKATSALDSYKSSFLDLAAKAATAYMAIQKAMEYMDLSAKAEQAKVSFQTLAASAGESADAILAAMKKATNGTIEDSDIMQKSAKAMLLGFSGGQIEQMGEMARLAARTSGETVGDAFSNIVDAISTNMPKTLKTYGLVTKDQFSDITQAMAEGVTEVNLFSKAWDNYNVQIAKTGPQVENATEKLQQQRAEMQKTREEMGGAISTAEGWLVKGMGFLAAGAATVTNSGFFGFDMGPMKAYFADLTGETAKVAATNLATALAKKAQDDANDKLELGKVTQHKANLEVMKALDKDYFASQDTNIKAMDAMRKAAGDDDYKIASDSLKKQETLTDEFYTRTKAEIALEADARTKVDKAKIDNDTYAAQKMQELDTETTNKKIALMQQERQLSITTAQNDIKNLTSRLGEYQTYYDSLKAKMDKSFEDEKKHLEELKALRQQYSDLGKSANDQLALINGTNKNITPQQTYETGRSDLNQQFMSITNEKTGQDLVKALDDYRQKVTALQQQFTQGVQGAKNIFGNPQDIISAAQVAEDASSDINRALAMQQSAVASLAEAKKQQADADQQWFQMLQEEANKAQTAMETLKTTIADLSTQIVNMQKTIELTGIDKVSSVVDSISERIKQLHDLAKEPMNFTATSGGVFSSKATIGSDGFTDIQNILSTSDVQNSYADGTNYVPRTGKYMLHQGEAVIPAAENKGGKSVTFGDVIIQIPANAAPQRPEDWRAITRNYIVPELRKLSS